MAQRSRLGGFSIDCRTEDLTGAARFWEAALGMRAAPGDATFVRLGRVGGLGVEVQSVDHTPRVHLDIAAPDVAAEVARIEALGATRLRAVEDWVVMEAPTGHRFCIVPADDADSAPAPERRKGGRIGHRSRLGVIVIDCQTPDLGPACAFWRSALGVSGTVDPDGKYAVLAERKGYPKLLLQSVEHESRVHLDIETDDREAEAARLEGLGASRVAALKGWIVMEAPTGHRFCIVQPQGEDFPGDAAEWGG